MSSAPANDPALTRAVALTAWFALALVLARAGVVAGLELVHHGDASLAGMRLAHAFPTLVATAVALALVAGLGARVARRGLAWFAATLVVAALAFLYIFGELDADASRRIGVNTGLGRFAVAFVALAALVLAAAFTLFARSRAGPRTWRAAALAPALLLVAGAGLRAACGGLGGTMEVRSTELELSGEPWEVVRARADAPPAPGVIGPAAEYRADGAARPALVLPPPATVRRTAPEAGGNLWLGGGAGVDHGVAAEVAERYPGHAVRFRVRIDGASAFEARVPLTGAEAWAELGGGDGLAVRPGAELELETALLDAAGREVEPTEPLRAGFGGLVLERRERLDRGRATSAQPNIVLVLLDTLRADRTSAYGYARPTTPHIAALAERGLLVEEACATATWTWPSTASILTGLAPEEHGVQDAASSFLAPRLDTLAEALQRVGYTTAAWSGSPLIVPDKGFDQGFEFFDASREGTLRRSDLVMPGALEWLGAAGDRRFFLYLHLMEPHAPFVPLRAGRALFASEVPTSFDPRKIVDYGWELQTEGFSATGARQTERVVSAEEQRWISDLYDACVWSGDHWVGELLARLDELGLSENTIVAVTSDHGEELFEHGLLSHAHSLHRELVRVPLVLAGPGIPRGERIAAPLSGAALGPTLARLGGSALAGFDATGDPLAALRAASDAPIFFSTRHGWWNGWARQPLFGVRRGSEVLHFAPEGAPWGEHGKRGSGELHLYDLARDPAEDVDVAPTDPTRAEALRAELLERLARLGAERATSGTVDEGTLEVLRHLGYVK